MAWNIREQVLNGLTRPRAREGSGEHMPGPADLYLRFTSLTTNEVRACCPAYDIISDSFHIMKVMFKNGMLKM